MRTILAVVTGGLLIVAVGELLFGLYHFPRQHLHSLMRVLAKIFSIALSE